MRLTVLVFAALFMCSPAFGQKEIEEREQTWLGYFNQTRFTDHSGVWVDLHYRLTNDFVRENSVSIARVGYTYYLSDQVRLTAGFALARLYAHTGPAITERRPWQQIQWSEKKKWFTLMQWFRVEERYRPIVRNGDVSDDFLFNWRFRYNIALSFPLKGKSIEPKTPFIFFNDEVHINAGKSIVNNYFDQNRLFLGVGYQFTRQVNAHLGYMYVFQQQPVPGQFVHINAIRLFVFHNIDIRNKE